MLCLCVCVIKRERIQYVGHLCPVSQWGHPASPCNQNQAFSLSGPQFPSLHPELAGGVGRHFLCSFRSGGPGCGERSTRPPAPQEAGSAPTRDIASDPLSVAEPPGSEDSWGWVIQKGPAGPNRCSWEETICRQWGAGLGSPVAQGPGTGAGTAQGGGKGARRSSPPPRQTKSGRAWGAGGLPATWGARGVSPAGAGALSDSATAALGEPGQEAGRARGRRGQGAGGRESPSWMQMAGLGVREPGTPKAGTGAPQRTPQLASIGNKHAPGAGQPRTGERDP